MTVTTLPNDVKAGVSSQAHHLANALTDRGHQVTVFTFSARYDESRYNVHQYRRPPILPRRRELWLAAYLAFTDFSAFDVVHAHGDNYLLWRCHPQVRTFHGAAKDEAINATSLRERAYYSGVALLEAISSSVADVNVGDSEATRRRLRNIHRVIPCGVDVAHFLPGPKSTQPSLLFVGTAGGRKRGQVLAGMFSHFVKSEVPEAELWAVTETPLVGNGVVNFGKVSSAQLEYLFRSAWAFCMPSTYEGFGVPYIEAMASGTPVVSTQNVGAVEVLDQGKFGILVTDAELPSTLSRVLTDARLRQHYADLGLIRAQRYSWENVTQEYEMVYDFVRANCKS